MQRKVAEQSVAIGCTARNKVREAEDSQDGTRSAGRGTPVVVPAPFPVTVPNLQIKWVLCFQPPRSPPEANGDCCCGACFGTPVADSLQAVRGLTVPKLLLCSARRSSSFIFLMNSSIFLFNSSVLIFAGSSLSVSSFSPPSSPTIVGLLTISASFPSNPLLPSSIQSSPTSSSTFSSSSSSSSSSSAAAAAAAATLLYPELTILSTREAPADEERELAPQKLDRTARKTRMPLQRRNMYFLCKAWTSPNDLGVVYKCTCSYPYQMQQTVVTACFLLHYTCKKLNGLGL
ncbi:hypothetical protein Cgig2_005370 [Carnegiea gigantea]|uniref:Uncharacterized protein n=1 Tax=Carnegiea gigantea TaxID=171969 RepID=A0A9Q1K719_9CARY|nr:hypothetical protein Cgig2_005370 [Carnegiea gigantea]